MQQCKKIGKIVGGLRLFVMAVYMNKVQIFIFFNVKKQKQKKVMYIYSFKDIFDIVVSYYIPKLNVMFSYVYIDYVRVE